MPRMVAQRVKNWAMTMSVPDAISWSAEMASEIKDKATATQKEAVAIVFSSRRVGLLMIISFSCQTWQAALQVPAFLQLPWVHRARRQLFLG